MLFNYNKCYSKNGKNDVFCVIYSERKVRERDNIYEV